MESLKKLTGNKAPSPLSEPQPTIAGYIKFFAMFYYVCFVIGLVFAFLSDGESFASTLFGNGLTTDLFMDFFNSMRDAGDPEVYSARNNIYPPLGLLFFKLVGFLVRKDLIDMPSKYKVLLQIDQKCMMIFVIFAIINLIMIMRVLVGYLNRMGLDEKLRRKGKLMSFLMMISYPVIYCLERGNIIIVCFVGTALFVFFHDSPNKIIRELSFIGLAVAAGIKLYPAIFGLILILEKKYKEAARTVLYGILAIGLPALVFIHPGAKSASIGTALTAEGDANILVRLMQNIMRFATKHKSKLNFSSVSIENFVYLFNAEGHQAAKVLCIFTEGIAAIGVLFSKKKWHQNFLIAYIMLNIPAASSSYALMFLAIPYFIFLFEEKDHTKIDKIFNVLFTLIFVPLPPIWYFSTDRMMEIFKSHGITYNAKLNQLSAGFIVQAIFFMIIGLIIAEEVRKYREKAAVAAKTETAQTTEGADAPEILEQPVTEQPETGAQTHAGETAEPAAAPAAT